MSTHRKQYGARIVRALAWSVILGVVAVVGAAVLVPRLAGGTPYVVLTGSMRPAMPPGTLVVTRPVDTAALGTGSVITYQVASGEPTVVTHRVVGQGISAAGEQVFRTQGDANGAPDRSWVRPVQIRGERWYSVPYLGYVTTLVSADLRATLQTVLIAGLALYCAFLLTGAIRERLEGRAGRRAALG